MRLSNKVVVITGAASGIGRAMVEQFTTEGARVVGGDRNAVRLQEAARAVQQAGGTFEGIVGDIGSRTKAESLVDTAVHRFGRVDVLVNNAGIMDHMAGVGEVTDTLWDEVLRVNLHGPMYASRRALATMLSHGEGVILNIASIAGLGGGAAGAAYTTSKHALIGLTRNTAWMYAPRGIRCNAICPGATRTNIAESMPEDQLEPAGYARAKAFAGLIPKWLDATDVAALALFLASDAARGINGAIITADGGWTAL